MGNFLTLVFLTIIKEIGYDNYKWQNYINLFLIYPFDRCGLLYQRTSNISINSFNSMIKTSNFALNNIHCASKCLHDKSLTQSCNAYSFDNASLSCELASLTLLEDPLPDGSDGGEKKIMVEVSSLETLPRTCRGGEHCCRHDQPCWQA